MRSIKKAYEWIPRKVKKLQKLQTEGQTEKRTNRPKFIGPCHKKGWGRGSKMEDILKRKAKGTVKSKGTVQQKPKLTSRNA